MRDPLNAKGYRTQRAESPEDLWQPLYDRANYAAAGASSLSFYSVPRGGSATLITAGSAAAKTKGYRDTNMDNANVVPAKLFKFIGVSIGFVHVDYTAATNANAAVLIIVSIIGFLSVVIISPSLLLYHLVV